AALFGMLWALIPGLLQAYRGSHLVITTIMFNYIGIILTGYLVSGPLQDPTTVVPETPDVLETARLPLLTSERLGLHFGIILAVMAAIIIYWIIWRTPFGFELRTVGLNPGAAAYAGISVKRLTVLTMLIAGILAGLAGTVETLGRNYYFAPGFNVGYGFDSIAIALLAKNHPIGVILTAFLFGAMDAGATRMQRLSGVPSEIIQVVQALILMFVAADQIIRVIYRLKAKRAEEADVTLSAGWGQR
ncbi:MAG: ABC transporter permease, partial [Chloroflexota bacterium]